MKKQILILLMVSVSFITLKAQVNLSDGLVAYYPFNGNVNDESGNGNNGTVVGAVFENDQKDLANSALKLNGNFVTLPENIYVGTDFTISTKIKVENFGQYARIFDFGTPWDLSQTPSTPSIRGRLGDFNGNISFEYKNLVNTFAGTTIESGSTLELDKWYSVIYVGSGNKISIYLDGIKRIETTITGAFTTGINTYKNNYINKANRTDYSNSPMYASFDEFRIYDRALNEAEIQALYIDCPNVLLPTIAITSNKLNTTSVTGFSYNWYFNESTISGANNTTLNDQLQVGVYKVKAKNGGCEVASLPFNIGTFPDPITISSINVITVTVCKIIIKDENGNTVTGIIQRNENRNVSIYPNPSLGVFRIESNLVQIEKIEIYNLIGTKVYETKDKEINIKGIPNGNYLIKLLDPDSKLIETRKMLIE